MLARFPHVKDLTSAHRRSDRQGKEPADMIDQSAVEVSEPTLMAWKERLESGDPGEEVNLLLLQIQRTLYDMHNAQGQKLTADEVARMEELTGVGAEYVPVQSQA
jgi:hypothetical protein